MKQYKTIIALLGISFLFSCKKENPPPVEPKQTGTPYQILDAQTLLPVAGAKVKFYSPFFMNPIVYTTNADGWIFSNTKHYTSVTFEKSGYLFDHRFTILPYTDMQKTIYLDIHIKDIPGHLKDYTCLTYHHQYTNIYLLPEQFNAGEDRHIIREGDLRLGYVHTSDFDIPFSGSPGDTVAIDCFY